MGGQPNKHVGHGGNVNDVSFSVYGYFVLLVLVYYLMGTESLTHPPSHSLTHSLTQSLSLSLTHTHKHIYMCVCVRARARVRACTHTCLAQSRSYF